GPGAVTAPRPFSAAPGLGGGTPVQTSQLAADAVTAPGAMTSAAVTKDAASTPRIGRVRHCTDISHPHLPVPAISVPGTGFPVNAKQRAGMHDVPIPRHPALSGPCG